MLTRLAGDFGEAVREANRMLSVRGRVLPATLESIVLVASHPDGSTTTGQRKVSESASPIERVRLEPAPPRAAADILRAITAADMIVLGPGSLYTSVIPNLLIPGIPEAIAARSGVSVYVANVAATEGETRGMSLADHIAAIDRHLPRRIIDCVLVNTGEPDQSAAAAFAATSSRRLLGGQDELAESPGYRYIREDVVDPINPAWHSPPKLARALMDIVESHRQ